MDQRHTLYDLLSSFPTGEITWVPFQQDSLQSIMFKSNHMTWQNQVWESMWQNQNYQ